MRRVAASAPPSVHGRSGISPGRAAPSGTSASEAARTSPSPCAGRAHPWARWNPSRTQAAGRETYLAERVALDSATSAVVCSAMPKAAQPEWSKARIRSDVPVLLVVGGNDPQDPLANVRGASRDLPASRTIVVPNAGHGALQLGCTARVAQQFIERGTAEGLDTRCVVRYAPPPFVVVR